MSQLITAITNLLLSKQPSRDDPAYQFWSNEYRKETFEYVKRRFDAGIFTSDDGI